MGFFTGSRFNNWYDYLLPHNYFLTMYDNIHEDGYQLGDLSAGLFGYDTVNREEDSEFTSSDAAKVVNQGEILGEVVNDSRDQFLEDREHTEQREDTAYQRAVEDMRAAGLNPYTVGASPSPSSASKVGENQISSKVQILGYLLNLQNLDFQNKKLINTSLTDLIGKLIK